MTLNLTIYPLGRGLYEARLDDAVVCKSSKTPFLSAARILLEAGHHPMLQITMQHAGSSIIAMRSFLSTAAKLTVEETDRDGLSFRTYRPHPGTADAPAATVGDTVEARRQGLR